VKHHGASGIHVDQGIPVLGELLHARPGQVVVDGIVGPGLVQGQGLIGNAGQSGGIVGIVWARHGQTVSGPLEQQPGRRGDDVAAQGQGAQEMAHGAHAGRQHLHMVIALAVEAQHVGNEFHAVFAPVVETADDGREKHGPPLGAPGGAIDRRGLGLAEDERHVDPPALGGKKPCRGQAGPGGGQLDVGVWNPRVELPGLGHHGLGCGVGVGVDLDGNGPLGEHPGQGPAQILIEVVDGRLAELVPRSLVGGGLGIFRQQARIGGLAVQKTQGIEHLPGFGRIGPVEKNARFQGIRSHRCLAWGLLVGPSGPASPFGSGLTGRPGNLLGIETPDRKKRQTICEKRRRRLRRGEVGKERERERKMPPAAGRG